MPKAGQRVEVNTFIQGLITEASPLNFPSNASKDEENFVLNKDGSRERRLGMEYEAGFVIRDAPASLVDTAGAGTYVWSNVAGISGFEVLVVQLGQTLVFYDMNKGTISGFPPIGSYITGTSSGYSPEVFPANRRYSFANVHGYLVVVGGVGDILAIAYDAVLQVFKPVFQRIIVRDLWGIEVKSPPSGLYPEGDPTPNGYESDPTYRGPLHLSHMYNLRNQSWGIPRRGDPAFSSTDPIDIFFNTVGSYPSNSEAVWTAMQYQGVVAGADPFERIYPKLYNEKLGSDTSSAKGYFLIDLLRRGTSRTNARTSNLGKYPALTAHAVDLPVDTTTGGATVVSEFAGRVFYAGFGGAVTGGDKRSPNLSGFILFSTLVTSPQDIGKCYQLGDPTSRETPDLIDTDGGFIRISGAKNIIAMEQIGTNLVVIAENGVWAITGGADNGFSATNYKVNKLSANGGSSGASIIRDGERILYWAEDAIYAVSKTQYGDLTVTPITITTIQKLYKAIPVESKKTVFGVYDAYERKAKWVYKDADGVTDIELVFDLTLKAFYKNRIGVVGVDSPKLYGAFPTLSFGVRMIKYLFLIKSGSIYTYSFSNYNRATFIDWKIRNGIGVDAKAFIETGAQCSGDSGIDKQIPYLTMHFKRTETGFSSGVLQNQSSCLVKSMWDWKNRGAAITAPLWQAYRIDKGNRPLVYPEITSQSVEVITTKSKVRGRGQAFSLYIETEPQKDCKILGWNITQNANTIT